MKFALNKNASVPYSPGERRLFDILEKKRVERHGGPVDTKVLTDLFYNKPMSQPFYTREALIRCLASLGRKIDANREPFMLFRTIKCGPKSQQVKLIPCQRRAISHASGGPGYAD